MGPDSFTARLMPGERILWSGRPGQGLILSSRDVFLIPFSLVWCGFAIVWEATALNGRNAPGFFLLWGAMFICIGLYFVVGRFLVDAWVRRGMEYAVTSQRVLIVRPAPFNEFISINLAQIPNTDLSERGDGRGSIRFGPAVSMSGRQSMAMWSPALDAVPQFLMIDNARRVFDLVQNASARP